MQLSDILGVQNLLDAFVWFYIELLCLNKYVVV